jgi:hypothetical protein
MAYREDYEKVYVVNQNGIYVIPRDNAIAVAAGQVDGYTALNKFGRNPAVGTTIVPITATGVYRTPNTLTSLEFVSSSTGDTGNGAGARTIFIQGIGANWAEVSETITTNGTGAVALANQYYRIYRWYVATSGTYATQSAGSHVGTLTLRVAGGGATWTSIGLVDGLGRGQSQISCYTVPAGKTLYIHSMDFSIDGTKSANIILFRRENANDVSAPVDAMRVVREYDGLSQLSHIPISPPLKFNQYADVGFMGQVTSGTASISVQFDGVLVNN